MANTKNRNTSHRRGANKIRKNFSDDFKAIFIVIATLLQGSIFLLICEHCLQLINEFSVLELSYFTLYFCVFVRIIQTHLLAAIKYSDTWSLFSLDFILVFLTAMFEYVLLKSEEIRFGDRAHTTSALVMIFCIYGIIGYWITLLRIMGNSDQVTKRKERTLQWWNISILAIILTLHIVLWAFDFFGLFFAVNFLTSILVGINVYLSMSLSMYRLMGRP